MTRDEVIKALERELEVVDRLDMDWEAGLLRAALNVLKAEPKRGRWLTCEDGWGDTHYQCSECSCEWFLNDGTPEENNMHYCPNCGAKMGDDDNDD